VLRGVGTFKDAKHLVVKKDKHEETFIADKFIIATGSKPGNLPFISLDKERIITSTEALSLAEIPKHLVVIGGGVIGLELGQVYRRLGAEVSVVEYADRIIPSMDAALSKELMKVLKKQGVQFYLSHSVRKVERKGNQVHIEALSKKGRSTAPRRRLRACFCWTCC
jgi:Pyruvate/2-oxoglutarate dehydrogenase complex, dihydrolipoamide dehydrogenase (E3) component, and related enzymes